MKTLENKLHELIESNNSVSEEARELLPLWRDNYRYTADLAEKSFLRLIFFGFLFYIVITAQVSEVSALGVKFENFAVPMLVSLLLCAYYFYRFIGLFCFAQNIEQVIREIYFQYFKSWQTVGLIDLTDHPSISQIENTYNALSDSSKLFGFVSRAGMLFVTLAFFVAPIMFFGWAVYSLFQTSLISSTSTVVISIVTGVIVVRSIFLIAQAVLLNR